MERIWHRCYIEELHHYVVPAQGYEGRSGCTVQWIYSDLQGSSSHLSTLMHHQDPSGWVSITVFVLFRAFLVTRTISISINESPPKKMINKFSISCSWVIWKIITFFTSHSNCCRKLAPPHSRVTCKTEINLNLPNRVFASFRSFLLPPCDMILGGVTTKYHIPGYRS